MTGGGEIAFFPSAVLACSAPADFNCNKPVGAVNAVRELSSGIKEPRG